MAKIVMLGSGIMATALSFPASENGNEVRLVGTHLDRDIIDSIKTKGIHPDLGLKVNEGVKAYQLEDAEEAFSDADVVMCGVNSFGIERAGEQLAGLLKPGQQVLCITKGMQPLKCPGHFSLGESVKGKCKTSFLAGEVGFRAFCTSQNFIGNHIQLPRRTCPWRLGRACEIVRIDNLLEAASGCSLRLE